MELALRSVGVVREGVCPEDPDGVDPTVAVLPQQVRELTDAGLNVSVETGAGALLGVRDGEYEAAGATIEPRSQILGGKDLVLKIKGLEDHEIGEMDRGSSLFCMAHLPMYPTRAAALRENDITVFAMEEVCEDAYQANIVDVTGRAFGKQVFDRALAQLPAKGRNIFVMGYSARMDGIIRYLALQDVAGITVVPHGFDLRKLPVNGHGATFIYDSHANKFELPSGLRAEAFDLDGFAVDVNDTNLSELFPRGIVPTLGRRRIECLHETGAAGAQWGLERLLERTSFTHGHSPEIQVLGYGNVAMGAVDMIQSRGYPVRILNRFHTAADNFSEELSRSNLVINGALIPSNRAGIDWVLTRGHVSENMRRGTVLVDLIGGSPSDPSPVEVVDTCTFLGRPSFDLNGVEVASVFAWPNFYRPLETCQRYSGQIAAVIGEQGGIAGGYEQAKPGTKRARVLAPLVGAK